MLTTTVTLEGNLATDPELRFTPRRQATGRAARAGQRPPAERRRGVGGHRATRHRVTCFGTLAENVSESLRTGDRVIVVGRISTDT